MKTILLCTACFFCLLPVSFAQWKQQASGVKASFHAIAFYDEKTGYAAGDEGVILKTTNGGTTWTSIASPDKSRITSVTLPDANTVIVTTANENGNAAVYSSYNGGKSWQKTLTDAASFYATAATDKTLYSISSQLYASTNNGRKWTPQYNLNPTSVYTGIAFTDKGNGFAAGNISGILTYSADFLRTTDGQTWYHGYNLNFPNANAFTAFGAIGADSILMFTNKSNGFMPGDSSQLILLHHFRLRSYGESTEWFFTPRTLISSFAGSVSGCRFFPDASGFAVTEGGNIYSVKTRGKSLTKEYSGTTSLHAVCMIDSSLGYAVGDDGLILKREAKKPACSSAISLSITAYPNPAKGQVHLSFTLLQATRLQVQVLRENGTIAFVKESGYFENGKQTLSLPLHDLPAGNYRLELFAADQSVSGSVQVRVIK